MFSDPLTQAIEASSVEQERYLVSRLHSILRPFLLRRLKRDVESQMPSKYEHVVRCTLTKRQRVRQYSTLGKMDDISCSGFPGPVQRIH